MTYISSLAIGNNLSIALYQESQPGGNISGWVWLIIILLIILIVAWAMISNRKREEFPLSEHAEEVQPAEIEASRAVAEVLVETSAAPPQAPDDLAIIEGIGPKISSVLQANGIATFAQLASTQTSELQQILLKEGLRLADPATWPEQARLAAAGDWDGLNALQAQLKGGRQA
jgi:predicted flap endonuclease-1-like 5' DNA nuclease